VATAQHGCRQRRGKSKCFSFSPRKEQRFRLCSCPVQPRDSEVEQSPASGWGRPVGLSGSIVSRAHFPPHLHPQFPFANVCPQCSCLAILASPTREGHHATARAGASNHRSCDFLCCCWWPGGSPTRLPSSSKSLPAQLQGAFVMTLSFFSLLQISLPLHTSPPQSHLIGLGGRSPEMTVESPPSMQQQHATPMLPSAKLDFRSVKPTLPLAAPSRHIHVPGASARSRDPRHGKQQVLCEVR